METITIRTEVWNDSKGVIVKAVIRKSDGTFVGATNQVKAVRIDQPATIELVGK